MTTLGKVVFITAILFSLLIWWAIEATTIDFESLKRVCPEGDCIGGHIPEMKVSVFYCKQ